LGQAEFQVMKEHGGSMVWSPLSNLMLYGRTARADLAQELGVPVALGSDWSPSGSKNLLHELKVARVASGGLGYRFSHADILAMATGDGASIVKWGNLVGSIQAGYRADLMAIAARPGVDAYSAILSASESDVQLVLIDGRPTVGTPSIMDTLGAQGETVAV